jgi:mRNA interferase MazF
MARILRGEVHWADLDPVVGSEQGGRRPVLVIQDDVLNERLPTTLVVAITSQPQRAGFPLTVPVASGEGGLPRDSWVKATQFRTVSNQRLRGRLGRISDLTMRRVEEALLAVMGIDATLPERGPGSIV